MDERFLKMYDSALKPLTEDRTPLYFSGDAKADGENLILNSGGGADFGTYFNAFSLKKWLNFSTLEDLKISFKLAGKFQVDFYGMNQIKEESFLQVETEGDFEKIFFGGELADLAKKFDMIAFRLTAQSDSAKISGATWLGKFGTVHDIKLGITICTFKREKYLLPNLEKLAALTKKNPDFSVMVIDNGQTLGEKHEEKLQILPNRNYGGSGGFTRGIIEQVNQGKNTHIILSDDDTVIELAAFDRLYSFLKFLKPEYRKNFFAGAMLNLAAPLEQVENTAYWNKIMAKSFGANFDLADKKILCKNEYPTKDKNAYAGWWFCVVPVESVKEIGYPLPIFIKGDDMEYGIRRGMEILTLNGVGVWHDAFVNKFNPAIKYFADRNMLLVQHFARDCGRFYFFAGCMARLGRRTLYLDGEALKVLELALKDLNTDLEGITSVPSDEKFTQVRNYPKTGNVFVAFFRTLFYCLKHCLNYDEHDRQLKEFVKVNLSDQKFWREFLKKTGGDTFL